MYRLRFLTCLVVFCLSVLGGRVRADGRPATSSPQVTPANETVSREVMALLMRAPGGTVGDFDLRVGPPPADFPSVLLPPGTVPEVTAIANGFTTVIGSHRTLSATDVIDQLPRVTAAGWVTQGPSMRGFVSASAEAPVSVCRGRDFAAISFVRREAGGIYVRVSLRNDPRQLCVARPDFQFPDVKVPVLMAPAGARAVSGGGGGGADEMYSRSRLESVLTAREASAHYARQFERDGWKVEGRANEGSALSVTRFSTTSTIGDAITGVLLVTKLEGSNDLDLIVHIVRNQMSRGRPGVPAPPGGAGRSTYGELIQR
jgi:hypothetical protein